MEEAIRELGGLNVLVNNAGVYGPFGAIEDVDWAEWVTGDRDQSLRFGHPDPRRAAAFQGAAATARSSRSPAAARPIRCPASAPTRRPRRRSCASPKQSPRNAGDSGIDVNSIAPGALNTRLLDDVLTAGPDKVGAELLRARDAAEGGGRAFRCSGGAELAVFLASAASDGITGKLISAVWDNWRCLARSSGGVDRERRLHACAASPAAIAASAGATNESTP